MFQKLNSYFITIIMINVFIKQITHVTHKKELHILYMTNKQNRRFFFLIVVKSIFYKIVQSGFQSD